MCVCARVFRHGWMLLIFPTLFISISFLYFLSLFVCESRCLRSCRRCRRNVYDYWLCVVCVMFVLNRSWMTYKFKPILSCIWRIFVVIFSALTSLHRIYGMIVARWHVVALLSFATCVCLRARSQINGSAQSRDGLVLHCMVSICRIRTIWCPANTFGKL